MTHDEVVAPFWKQNKSEKKIVYIYTHLFKMQYMYFYGWIFKACLEETVSSSS